MNIPKWGCWKPESVVIVVVVLREVLLLLWVIITNLLFANLHCSCALCKWLFSLVPANNHPRTSREMEELPHWLTTTTTMRTDNVPFDNYRSECLPVSLLGQTITWLKRGWAGCDGSVSEHNRKAFDTTVCFFVLTVFVAAVTLVVVYQDHSLRPSPHRPEKEMGFV